MAAFSTRTAAQVKAAAADVTRTGATKLLVDIRRASGGSNDAGLAVARLFVGKGTLAKREARGAEATSIDAGAGDGSITMPVTILADNGTSGAAEIFASSAAVEPVFVRIAAEVARREDVVIGCRDAALAGHVRGLLAAAGVDATRVRLHVVASQDTWARDHGPLTVIRRGAPLLLDFTFNGWGGKFAAEQDDQISRRLHALGAFGAEAMASVDLVLEGGSVESDGAGTLLTYGQPGDHIRIDPEIFVAHQ